MDGPIGNRAHVSVLPLRLSDQKASNQEFVSESKKRGRGGSNGHLKRRWGPLTLFSAAPALLKLRQLQLLQELADVSDVDGAHPPHRQEVLKVLVT